MTTIKKNNFYFTKETEDAIIRYAQTDSKEERNQLYKTHIGPTLKELIDNVVQVYKFGTLPNIAYSKEECLLYLMSILNKFDKNKISTRTNKTSSAFNYLTVVSKHFFFALFRKNKKQKYEEIDIEDLYKSTSQQATNLDNPEEIVTYNEYDLALERHEFKQALLEEFETWKIIYKNDQALIKTLSAIIILIENINEIDFFNKKGIFVYLRELTGLETKDISISIKKIGFLFKEFKIKWEKGTV